MPGQCTPRIAITCANCGAIRMCTPYQIANGRGKYCSHACRNIARTTSLALVCETCGRSVRRKRSDVSAHTYCSIPCRANAPAAAAILSEDGLSALLPLQARDGSITGYATIDAADVQWASQWRWHTNVVTGRVVRNDERDGRQQAIWLHRELMGLAADDPREVDHIDRDVLNMRRSNLRPATRAQNAQNLAPRKGTSSPYRGVSWNRSTGRWLAYINVDRKRTNLGVFDTEVEAAIAAREARARLMPYAID